MVKALYKAPDGQPVLIDLVNGIKSVKEKLEGSMEAWSLTEEVAIYCNSESFTNGMAYNCTIGNFVFNGPILLLRFDEEAQLESVTDEDIQMLTAEIIE